MKKISKQQINEIAHAIMLFIGGVCLMLLVATCPAKAQEVQRNGNNFTQVAKEKTSESKETKTEFTYTDTKGNVYPVYLSSTGKAFIKKISKKTGKEYKFYIPEVGKQINPEAYENTDH
jgi:hypothetical protein